MKRVIISGGNGTERLKYVSEYLKEITTKDNKVVIYDATYNFVSYSHNKNVFYYSADTINAYKNKLIEILNSLKNGDINTYSIISDCYAAFMLSNDNVSIFKELMNYDVNIVLSARHLSFVHEDLINSFDETIELDDINTVLSNDYNKNLK